jgi:hypothetical protein
MSERSRARKRLIREAQQKAERVNARRRAWWESLTWTQQQEYVAKKVLEQNARRASAGGQGHGSP